MRHLRVGVLSLLGLVAVGVFADFAVAQRNFNPRYNSDGPSNPNIDLRFLGPLIEGGMRAIRDADRPPPRQREYYDDNQPNYYYPPPAPPPPAPPKNVVAPKKAPKNAAFKLTNDELQLMSAELDARQSGEAAKAGGKLDAALESQIAGSALPPALKQEMRDAWASAVTSGDPSKFQEFKNRYGGNLPGSAQKMLDTRIELANYGADLEAGRLSFTQKETRLQQIDSMINGMDPSILKDGLKDNFVKMEQYNNLGNLVDLTQGSNNPLQTILLGVNNMGEGAEFIGEISGLPIMATDPNVSSTVQIHDIMLFNDARNSESVSYQLDAKPYVMSPGSKQSFSQSYVISFETQPGGAAKRYQLTKGVYRFAYGAGGWDLKRLDPTKVTIDNSAYNGTFKYLINGNEVALAAGEVKEHTDSKAFQIEFDRGNGTTARKVVAFGTHQVVVNASDSLLDLNEVIESSTVELAAETESPRAAKPQVSKAQRIEEALARLKAKKP